MIFVGPVLNLAGRKEMRTVMNLGLPDDGSALMKSAKRFFS